MTSVLEVLGQAHTSTDSGVGRTRRFDTQLKAQ